MERFDEFSSIEQAAMEQSPAHETDVRHNFMELSSFLDDVAHVAEDIGHAAEKVAKVATPETPEVAEVTVAAAGGVIVDGVFTKEHTELLKSIDKECSVNQLIDLRNNLNKANRMLK
ncbi:hypothetical protein [uncultured Dokdonia sp.]|uniref:hypothetical protein n=1 Tax=uncultured Dokdonia sp. TaxID=575653 RepID=UPI0026320356|nr:hypothetical protein [uncultured Dokdonia sp.]